MNRTRTAHAFRPLLAATLFAATLLAAALLAAACAGDPPGFDTPESALHDVQADVYLVSNIHGAPSAKDNNGYISRVVPDGGGAMERYWIRGGRNGVTLHAPKGMALRGEELWVADIDVLRVFDRSSGRAIGVMPIPGATFLNDVSAGPDGHVYCSDSGLDASFQPTGTDAIWRVKWQQPREGAAEAPPPVAEVLIRGVELGQPNGIVARQGGVYVVSWRDGTFYQVDYRGTRTDLGRAPKAKLDGLARVEPASESVRDETARAWLATSWEGGCVYRFEVTGACTELPARFEQPADCGYDAGRRRLLVPLFGGNRLELLQQ